MARYYFHIRDGWSVVPDEEGMELPSWDAAREEAYTSARDLARSGQSRVCSIEIADQEGNVLGCVGFPKAA